ncbi:MAG TPA: peptide chain release factor 2 [Candidatus Cloacimonadota bacterium]|nr:peptide chain release factor 2 [Candidatus Cloacimonadota bacterium]
MELFDYKRETEQLIERIFTIRRLLDISAVKEKITTLESEMHKPDFWNDQNQAKKTSKELSSLQSEVQNDKSLKDIQDEMETYLLLLEEDFQDSLFQEAAANLQFVKQTVDKIEIEFLLNGKYDRNNAILTIHGGAGGTEAQDWAEMLLRMYNRWADAHQFKFVIVDILAGEEAGIKSATVEVNGNFAYGLLKAEIGIHRLVRISPFNAQGKRQTSFASVFVIPEIEDDIDIDIDPKDLKIDTYRSSGAGGQHVNTTDSAVRITHIPTNIVANCQNERSQIQNREKALQILKSKLFQYYEEKREKERQALENTKTDIGWGNQIRSYVFQPYQMVKDHRTNFENGNTSSVMDGDLDGFINAYLKWYASEKVKA